MQVQLLLPWLVLCLSAVEMMWQQLFLLLGILVGMGDLGMGPS